MIEYHEHHLRKRPHVDATKITKMHIAGVSSYFAVSLFSTTTTVVTTKMNALDVVLLGVTMLPLHGSSISRQTAKRKAPTLEA